MKKRSGICMHRSMNVPCIRTAGYTSGSANGSAMLSKIRMSLQRERGADEIYRNRDSERKDPAPSAGDRMYLADKFFHGDR